MMKKIMKNLYFKNIFSVVCEKIVQIKLDFIIRDVIYQFSDSILLHSFFLLLSLHLPEDSINFFVLTFFFFLNFFLSYLLFSISSYFFLWMFHKLFTSIKLKILLIRLYNLFCRSYTIYLLHISTFNFHFIFYIFIFLQIISFNHFLFKYFYLLYNHSFNHSIYNSLYYSHVPLN